jgi:hypothetical protein
VVDTGSLFDKTLYLKKTMLADEKLEDIWARSQIALRYLQDDYHKR